MVRRVGDLLIIISVGRIRKVVRPLITITHLQSHLHLTLRTRLKRRIDIEAANGDAPEI